MNKYIAIHLNSCRTRKCQELRGWNSKEKWKMKKRMWDERKCDPFNTCGKLKWHPVCEKDLWKWMLRTAYTRTFCHAKKRGKFMTLHFKMSTKMKRRNYIRQAKILWFSTESKLTGIQWRWWIFYHWILSSLLFPWLHRTIPFICKYAVHSNWASYCIRLLASSFKMHPRQLAPANINKIIDKTKPI